MKKLILLFLSLISTAVEGQVIMNELMASNETTLRDPDFGAFSDWIELYNGGDQIIDISGYFISDDSVNLTKWVVPGGIRINPDDYLIIWADGKSLNLHTNFKLSKSGEGLFLCNKDTILIDQIVFGNQTTDISFGRETDGAANWIFFKTATPGSTNNSGTPLIQAGPPVFSINGGFYPESVSVALQSSSPTAVIRYTTDGSPPDENSRLYEDSIIVTTRKVIRARVFDDGYDPSPVITNTYFINQNKPLPVIALSTSDAYLWSDTAGIYVEGTNGIPGNCREKPMNWNQDWEVPVNIEFYDTAGSQAFNQQAGMKIFGGCSRTMPQKSLSIIARSKYGENRFNYPLFDNLPFDSYKSFILRNSGNDWQQTFIRDALFTGLVDSLTKIDHQAYRPVVVYLNGNYWGIHNMREKINEHFLAAHHNVNPDEINLLEGRGWAIHGRKNDYDDLMNYLQYHDLVEEAAYEYVKKEMDIDNYIDYQIVQIIIGNTDWPGNNIRFWKTNDPDSKWRWILYDTDFGFHLFDLSDVYHNTLTFAAQPDGEGWPNPPWSTFLFRKLLENHEFRRQFLDRFQFLLNNIYNPERVIERINSMQSGIASEMPRHLAKWQSQSLAQWKNQIERLREYAAQRPNIIVDYVTDFFGLEPAVSLNLRVAGPGKGVVRFKDGLKVKNTFTGHFYKNEFIHLRAESAHGYRFESWKRFRVKTSMFFNKESDWKYLDDGSDQGTAWREPAFDDAGWKSGKGSFGYGNGDERTKISYGGDAANKYITTYFRKAFYVDAPDNFSDLEIALMRDDGAVVYLNGNEILRSNMPSWEIQNFTTASSAITGAEETTYTNYSVSSEFLQKGVNVIAVEIHQASKSSSDIRFDMSLSGKMYEPVEVISDNAELIFFLDRPQIIGATFSDASLVINEVHYNPSEGASYAFVELYNQGNSAINLSGYRLTGSVEFVFPDTATLPVNGFLVIAADSGAYQTLDCPVFQWEISDFSATYDTIRLTDGYGAQADIVVFEKNSPWPVLPDGFGPSLELCYPFLDKDLAANWKASNFAGGTPGKVNSKGVNSGELKINEVLAANRSVLYDEHYDFDDWIEIYNAGPAPVDMEGVYLSDDRNNLIKSRIRAGDPYYTVIPPGGFKLLWADGQPKQGPFHLNFKLDKSGEVVYLSDSSGTLLDSLYFATQQTDVSIGKYKDGVDYLFLFQCPTPGASNNFAPEFKSDPVLQGFEKQTYTYDIIASDMDGDNIKILGRIPSWLTLTDMGDGKARLSGTPGKQDAGENIVKIIATDGISGSTEQYFTIDVAAITSLAVDEPAEISVFPNPFSNRLHIRFAKSERPREVRVLSLAGKSLISHRATDKDNGSIILDVSRLTPGLFFLHLSFPTHTKIYKILKN